MDLCDHLGSRVHKMLYFPLPCLRHPHGRSLLEYAISTYATVVSLRGSVGMSSIRSAVSYVVAVVNLCVVFRECLAYALRIANVLGVTPLFV